MCIVSNSADADEGSHALANMCISSNRAVDTIQARLTAGNLMAAGIGFSAHGVKLDRLPGWDPHSYGYHGDDGMAFQSCGTGKPYGPIFATGQ